MAAVAELCTRFDGMPRRWALCLGLLFLVLIGVGLESGVAHNPQATPEQRSINVRHKRGDGYLYQRITRRVAGGESYYAAATAEQRAAHYPLRPVSTIREPTYAWIMAALPSEPLRKGCLAGLTLLGICLWVWRFQSRFHNAFLSAWCGVSLLSSCAFGFWGTVYLFHEAWAAVLIMVSLAAWDVARSRADLCARRIWLGGALALGLLAVLIRELSVGFLLVMAVAALLEKRRRESVLWLGTIVVFALFMLWHAHMAASYVFPGDKVSPGWLRLLGWAKTLMMLRWNALFLASAAWFSAVLVPLMLLGALGWPGGTGARLFFTCAGYCAGFCIFGRLVNDYWGLLVTPLFGLSLGIAPICLLRLGYSMVRKV